jgi:hypothetical protein
MSDQQAIQEGKQMKTNIKPNISANPVYLAVMPLKEAAIARAEKHANEQVTSMTEALKTADWRINVVAPRPNSYRMSRFEYKQCAGRRSMFDSITTDRKGQSVLMRYEDTERRVDLCDKRIANFISCAKKDAAAQYDAFVEKLVAKVGDVTAATLAGCHVWGHSVLTVVTAAGESQRWQTQMIMNVSCLGKLFNQWPTRKLKN